MFAFLVYFHHKHFEIEIDDIIPAECFYEILKIETNLKELKEKAYKRIEEEQIDVEYIRDCPNCEEDTYILGEEEGICYLCRYKEQNIQCQHCGEWYPEWEFKSFKEKLDWDYEEGLSTLWNSYGYGYDYDGWKCCESCYPKICESIQKQIDEEYYDYMEEEYHYRSKE